MRTPMCSECGASYSPHTRDCPDYGKTPPALRGHLQTQEQVDAAFKALRAEEESKLSWDDRDLLDDLDLDESAFDDIDVTPVINPHSWNFSP